MESTNAKLGAAVGAAILGVGLPLAASAQEVPADQPDAVEVPTTTSVDMTSDAAANQTADAAASLASMGSVSASQVALVDVSTLPSLNGPSRLDAQSVSALRDAMVSVQLADDTQAGTNAPGRTLADYLGAQGVDAASIVGMHVGSDGSVTVLYDGSGS